jgi:hypothetical protein
MKHLIAKNKIARGIISQHTGYVVPSEATKDVCIGNEVFIELFEQRTMRRAHDQGTFIIYDIVKIYDEVCLFVDMI